MNATANPSAAIAYPITWSMPAIDDVDALLAHIEAEASLVLRHPAADRMRRGDVPPRIMARILANIAFQSFHGPMTFALAGARLAQSHPALGAYLIEHAGEETGHWRWAMEDLTHVAGAPSPAELQPSHEALAYAGWIYFLAQSQPLARIGSAALLERLSTRCSDLVAGIVATAPAALRSQVFRFARNHATTDLAHWAEIQAVLRETRFTAGELGLIAWAATATRRFYVDLFAMPFAAGA